MNNISLLYYTLKKLYIFLITQNTQYDFTFILHLEKENIFFNNPKYSVMFHVYIIPGERDIFF